MYIKMPGQHGLVALVKHLSDKIKITSVIIIRPEELGGNGGHFTVQCFHLAQQTTIKALSYSEKPLKLFL